MQRVFCCCMYYCTQLQPRHHGIKSQSSVALSFAVNVSTSSLSIYQLENYMITVHNCSRNPPWLFGGEFSTCNWCLSANCLNDFWLTCSPSVIVESLLPARLSWIRDTNVRRLSPVLLEGTPPTNENLSTYRINNLIVKSTGICTLQSIWSYPTYCNFNF